MTSVIAVVIALLIIFLVLVISLLIAYKKQKLCFQGRNSDTQLADSHPPVAPPSLVGRWILATVIPALSSSKAGCI